jgi:hypothetical protein
VTFCVFSFELGDGALTLRAGGIGRHVSKSDQRFGDNCRLGIVAEVAEPELAALDRRDKGQVPRTQLREMH